MVDEVSGARGTSRRARVLVALAVVLVLVVLAADRWQADRERAALLTTVEEAETTVTASLDSLLSLAGYAGPLLTNEDVPPASRRSALTILARDAARWEPRVRAREERVQDAAVLPWHGSLRAARQAYVGRLDTWADLLATTAGDPEALLGGGDGDVRATRQRAVDALLVAGVDPERLHRTLGRGTLEPGEAAAPARR